MPTLLTRAFDSLHRAVNFSLTLESSAVLAGCMRTSLARSFALYARLHLLLCLLLLLCRFVKLSPCLGGPVHPLRCRAPAACSSARGVREHNFYAVRFLPSYLALVHAQTEFGSPCASCRRQYFSIRHHVQPNFANAWMEYFPHWAH